ncbi:hypothetical protein [Synechococcus sp. W70.1]|uniref:hypothetical protein n=1 Tax=Synechococcus sp. W70.1 TaxID=2964534 RepID=UPI0039C1D1EC
MVILDYSDAESGFWASTPQGLVEVIRFQNHFYARRQVCKCAQDAISACRADIERGFLSIVVQFENHAEVWAQLSPGVPVQSQPEAAPTGNPAKPKLTYRGQPVSEPSRNPSLARRPLPDSLYFRGAKIG